MNITHRLGATLGAVALTVAGVIVGVLPADAATGPAMSVSVSAPTTYIVGTTGLPMAVSVVSYTPDANLTLTSVVLTPSCAHLAAAGRCAQADSVIKVRSAVGEANTGCANTPFAVKARAGGKLNLVASPRVTLGPVGSLTNLCRIDLVVDVVAAPTGDASASMAGVQTAATVTASGISGDATAAATGSTLSTVTS